MTDYDSPWKEALERYLPAFLEFFFPEAYREICWGAGYEFLDKELQQVVRDDNSAGGWRISWSKSGATTAKKCGY